MPNTKSAIRTQRKQDRRRLHNEKAKKAFKTAVRNFKKSPSNETLDVVYKAIDKAAKNKIIAKNKASRLKSRLSKLASKLMKDHGKKASSSDTSSSAKK